MFVYLTLVYAPIMFTPYVNFAIYLKKIYYVKYYSTNLSAFNLKVFFLACHNIGVKLTSFITLRNGQKWINHNKAGFFGHKCGTFGVQFGNR